jgi:hypothetical protein
MTVNLKTDHVYQIQYSRDAVNYRDAFIQNTTNSTNPTIYFTINNLQNPEIPFEVPRVLDVTPGLVVTSKIPVVDAPPTPPVAPVSPKKTSTKK